jgi:hypothetical protein
MNPAAGTKACALTLFKRRVGRWAAKIGTKPERVYVQAMRRKWASTSTTGRVCFSSDLLKQAPSFQDFVIAHELLHLVVPNHGPLFKSFLKAYVPKAGPMTRLQVVVEKARAAARRAGSDRLTPAQVAAEISKARKRYGL